MRENTPFGILVYPESVDRKKIEPVLRALDWCETLLAFTQWTRIHHGESISLQRTVNNRVIDLFPLEAAAMDLGYKTRFNKHHLPIHLDQANVCVRSTHTFPRPLHTDMMASMILFLGGECIEPAEVPKTLHRILTSEQLASLPPPPPPRQRTVPGQPSTSGRAFLPETEILNLMDRNPLAVFQIQFEKRDGTLRSMNAQCANWQEPLEDQEDAEEPRLRMRYDPAVYNLRFVVDTDLDQYRLVATDRVTEFIIGERNLRTESAE